MEFFREINGFKLAQQDLQKLLSIHNLPVLCQSISSVISDQQTHGVIYCIWGEFRINREPLKHGIRFSLPNCPNAFVWTITVEDDNEKILIHATINKRAHDKDFLDSIEVFINDWSDGIKHNLNRQE